MVLFVTVGTNFTCPEMGPTIQNIKMQCKFAADFRYYPNNILNHKYVLLYTKIVIFLLKCKKQASGTIHCGYYYCWYMLCNANGKYTKHVLDYGADVSISNFNYGFNFYFSFFN
jgi:hypothetical protein